MLVCNEEMSNIFTAVKFGRGVYFTNKSFYSAKAIYAAPDEKQLHHMYLARVLVGKFTKGKENLLEPPLIDNNNQNVRYDSVVDDVANPLIFVIFYDFQSYPEYLITYKGS